MRKDVTLDEWIEALESGRYRRGSSQLRRDAWDGTKHCCLGVLCELAETHWHEDFHNLENHSHTTVVPELFGPEIEKLLTTEIDHDVHSCFACADPATNQDRRAILTHLMHLNDMHTGDDYIPIVKYLRNLP